MAEELLQLKNDFQTEIILSAKQSEEIRIALFKSRQNLIEIQKRRWLAIYGFSVLSLFAVAVLAGHFSGVFEVCSEVNQRFRQFYLKILGIAYILLTFIFAGLHWHSFYKLQT